MLTAALVALSMGTVGDTLVFPGGTGPGKGKHIVLLTGDEEYRSEEMMPQLAKILSQRHGFKCTVVFSLNDKGEIDPEAQTRQPGLEALKTADACFMLLRFRQWSDETMQHFVDYYQSGKPIIALRTSTHAFNYSADSTSAFKHYGWQSKTWAGGFGKQVLGETWVSHWGNHGSQATRAKIISPHPVLQGIESVFGTTDVYEAAPPADAQILMQGEVVAGMQPSDAAAVGRKKTAKGIEQELNEPKMPILWMRQIENDSKRKNKVLTCTMGAATDFLNPGFRRLMVNSAYWATDLEVPKTANVVLVGTYSPSKFGFGSFKRGVKPADLN